jgi:hypothetical protein
VEPAKDIQILVVGVERSKPAQTFATGDFDLGRSAPYSGRFRVLEEERRNPERHITSVVYQFSKKAKHGVYFAQSREEEAEDSHCVVGCFRREAESHPPVAVRVFETSERGEDKVQADILFLRRRGGEGGGETWCDASMF